MRGSQKERPEIPRKIEPTHFEGVFGWICWPRAATLVDMKPMSSSKSSQHQTYEQITGIAKAHEGGGTWDRFAQALSLSADPGAAVPLLDALAAAFTAFPANSPGDLPGIAALRSVVGVIISHSAWKDGQWRPHANRSRTGGRHGGNVADRPLLACLVAHRLPEQEQTTVDGLRLLLVAAILHENTPATAALRVADSTRRVATVEAWRQVVRNIPPPELTGACLQTWFGTVAAYLEATATPPALANLPAHSIRAFYVSLRSLLTLVAQVPAHSQGTVRRQGDLFYEASTEPSGVLRKVPDNPRPRARPAGGDPNRHHDAAFAERTVIAQEVLSFDAEATDSSIEPANVTLVVQEALSAHEQPASNSAAAVEFRHASYRLIEMKQRLVWSWDHLNPFDLALIVTTLRADLAGAGPRLRGAIVAAVMLSMGKRAPDVPTLGLQVRPPSGDWIDRAGTWHRRVLRPAKAWRGTASLRDALVPTQDEVSLHLHPTVQQALVSLMENAPRMATLGEALDLTTENVITVLSSWLDPLRAANVSARLTHGRISRALSARLMAASCSEMQIHALTANAEDVAPIISYYAALSTVNLQTAYAQALNHIFDEKLTLPAPPAGQLGALVLQPPALARWIAGLRDAIYSAATLSEQHNSYCLYVLWHMMACTGHRPVNDPVESITIFDLHRGLMLIADKSAHSPGEARLVPLSPLSVGLLDAWLEHLGRLSRWLTADHPTLAARIDTIIQSRGQRSLPLFFLFREGFEIERIGRGSLTASLPVALAELPPNQHRRELATLAIAQGWPHELTEELLGHVELGQPAFGALSPRCPSESNHLKPLLGDVLARQGWIHLESPLDAGPTRRGRPLPRARPAPIALGSAERRQQVEQCSKRSVERMERVLRRWCRSRHWRTLAQRDVDSLYQDVLEGRGQPNTVSELSMLQRIDRILRWVKRRYGLTPLRLPASRLRTSVPATFVAGDMAQSAQWSVLGEAFVEVLRARARARGRVSPDRLFAEALVSLPLHSRICDANLLRYLMQQRCWRIVDVPSVATFLVVETAARDGSLSVRRYPLHPLSLALLSRLGSSTVTTETSGPPVRRAIERLISTLRQRVVGGAAPEFANAEVALAWLCDVCAVTARMQLPGHLAAYLDGSTAAVGLPEADWLRWMTGRPVKSARGEEAPDSHAESLPDRPAEPLLPCRTTKSDGEQRAAALALHHEVRRAFNQVDFKAVERREESNRSTNRIEHLLPLLHAALQRHAEAPEFARAVVQWLIELLQHGLNGSELRAASCERYYTALMRRIIDTLHGVALREVDEDALTAAYALLMEQVPPRGQSMVLGRLREFHAFLVREHGAPELDWSDVTPEGMERWYAPDSGVVLWPDYRHALHLLLEDPTVDLREQCMQAFVLVLMYRFGLRAGEVMGLRSSDFLLIGSLWIVLVRPNQYREIKTDSGIRQVPLIGPLDATEEQVFRAWREHADEYVSSDRVGALISRWDKPRHLVDRDRITRRITDALRAVTGSTTLRPHHLRHSYASRLVALLGLADLPAEPKMLALAKDLLGPCEPRQTQELLLGTPGLSKRGFWSAALALGHASPATALRWYTHVHDWLLVLAIRPLFVEHEVRLDSPTTAYASGKARRPSRHKVVLDMAWARHQSLPGVTGAQQLALPYLRANTLPPRPERPAAPLDLLTIDRLLEIVHRRGCINATLMQRLMLPHELIVKILAHDHTVREQAGYDVPESGWAPTTSTHAVSHVRAGARHPIETERVRRSLRALAERQGHLGWIELSRQACRTWRERYRAPSTPIVVTSMEEANVLAHWCVESGIEAQDLLLLSPPEQAPPELPAQHPNITRQRAALASARTLYRSQGRTRFGLQLRENDRGPLTHMTQLNRILHVVSVWLLVTDNA